MGDMPEIIGNQKSRSDWAHEYKWEFNKSKNTYECKAYDQKTNQLLGVCNTEQEAILRKKVPIPELEVPKWEPNKSKKTYECKVYNQETNQLLGVCDPQQELAAGAKPIPVRIRRAKPRLSVGEKPKYKQAGTYRSTGRQWGGAQV